MKIDWKLTAVSAIAIATLPTPALANAGTPLLWLGMFHLFLGNTIVGIFEGIVLTKLFSAPRKLAISLLIVANYASAWAGIVVLPQAVRRFQNLTLENLKFWLWIIVAVAFLLTLLIEYPFFWFILRQHEKAVWKALKATLIIHGISYLCLFGLYSCNSHTSLLTQLEIVPLQQLQPSSEYALYFINADGTQLMRSRLDGQPSEQVKDLENIGDDERLCFRENGEKKFDLLTNRSKTPILADFAQRVPNHKDWEYESCRSSPFARAPKLTESSHWQYETSVWAGGGIMGFNRQDKLSIHFALETPFVFWNARHATHLEGDFIVFQLHKDQIYLLQPQRKKIALIARGRSPVVVVPKS